MISSGRFCQQVLRHFRREKRLSLGSFLVLGIVLILVDIFWLASININEQYHQILSQAKMEVYISEDLPDSLIPVLDDSLINMNHVAAIDYISKDEAIRILENNLGPGLIEILETNPLPRSFIVHFTENLNLSELDHLHDGLQALEGVDIVEFERTEIEKVEDFGKKLKIIGFSAGGLILFTVLLTMANTNRLTARSKSRDFFQLKLLGAGPSYLIYPYLAEGFLSAFIAAGLGWLIILYTMARVSFTSFSLVRPAGIEVFVYCIFAGVMGMAGAYLGIRRFIKHE